jgi:hypothetical protein
MGFRGYGYGYGQKYPRVTRDVHYTCQIQKLLTYCGSLPNP